MIVFGRWPLWFVVALFTFAIAAALVTAKNLVLATALVAIVVTAASYSLRGGAGR